MADRPETAGGARPALAELRRRVATLQDELAGDGLPAPAAALVRALGELNTAQQAALEAGGQDTDALRSAIRRAKRRLAVTVHDLKAPITVSLLNLELIEMEEDPKEQVYYLSGVRRELEFMLDTIGNLLELQRAGTGAAADQPDREPVLLHGIVEAAMERMRVPTRDKTGLALVNSVPLELPPLSAHPHRVTRLFNNLLSNAIKYTESGKIEVRGAHDPATGVTRVEVADTGLGIDPARIPTLFDYYTGDTERAESTGVGLAFVKHVVDGLRGKVWIESERGAGTLVVMEFRGG